MTNTNNRPDLDEELAAMTDRLLAGQDQAVSPENEALANMVKKLYNVVGSSSSSSVSPATHARLTQRLNEEWDAVGHRQHTSGLRIAPRTVRLLSMAAALVTVLVFVLIIIGQTTKPVTTTGTALNGDPALALVIVAILAAATGAFWWFRRR